MEQGYVVEYYKAIGLPINFETFSSILATSVQQNDTLHRTKCINECEFARIDSCLLMN